MPSRKKSTATQAPCNGCGCCSRDPKDHTCPIATKVPPQTVSKEDLFKPIKAARKEKTPTAHQIASAPVNKASSRCPQSKFSDMSAPFLGKTVAANVVPVKGAQAIVFRQSGGITWP